MLKCVNAWQCLRRAQLERVGVGVPGDGGPQNALSSPMFLLFVRVFIFGFAADLDSDDLWFPAFMQHAMQGPSCVCVQNVLVS